MQENMMVPTSLPGSGEPAGNTLTSSNSHCSHVYHPAQAEVVEASWPILHKHNQNQALKDSQSILTEKTVEEHKYIPEDTHRVQRPPSWATFFQVSSK
jgi:hypothetical protein